MMIPETLFRDACSRFATGVAIATVTGPSGAPHGLTVSAYTSLSLAPALLLVCIDRASSILPIFRESPHFAINVLTETQRDLSVAFSVKPEGRFDGVAWAPGRHGQPLLKNILAHFECGRVQIVTAGDHDILIGEVLDAQAFEGRPLIYFHRNYRSLR